MTRFAALALLAAALAPRAGASAQIFTPAVVYPPAIWLSGVVGYYNPGIVHDGSTGTTWTFGAAPQWRASVELPLRGGEYSLGVVGAYSHMPLRYYGGGPEIDPTGAGVDAHADLWSLFGVFRAGGTLGFHQIIEIMGGAVGYRRFRLDEGNRPLPPPGTDKDLSIGIGYGFGYSLSPRSEITLVQDYAVVFHQQNRLPSGTGSSSTQTVLRAGLRVGLGSAP